MSKFQREDRYIVIKRSDVDNFWRDDVREQFKAALERLNEHHVRVQQREYVVIESDWPEYEPVWQMIERRMTGQPEVKAAEELNAVLHWRDKHTQAIRERDALQQLLNMADQRADDLVHLLSEAREWINQNHYGGPDACNLVDRVDASIKRPAKACLFPQSCTTRCDCDIPDFSPGNGNKARRRAETIHGFKIVEDPTMAPNEIRPCNCNQGRLPCTCKPSAYDGFDNGSD